MNKIRDRGFTLIELVMVMVIVGIMAVVASPIFQNFPQMRAEMAAFKLRSDIRYAQIFALQSSLTTRIVFNAVTNSYQLEHDNGVGGYIPIVNPANRDNYTVNFNTGDFQGVTLSSVQLAAPTAGNPNIIIFNGAGAPFYVNLAGTAVPLQEPSNVVLNAKYQMRFRSDTGKVDIVTL